MSIINEGMRVLAHPERNHIARYVYEPIFPASELWLKGFRTTQFVPKSLRDEIEEAIDDIKASRNSASVVQSTIVIESILAEFYEEKLHEPAPEQPLGVLLEQISAKIGDASKQPLSGLLKQIAKVNDEARKSAAHRSTRRVTQEDSKNALWVAIRTVIWRYKVFGE
jgi:hypothetical protein